MKIIKIKVIVFNLSTHKAVIARDSVDNITILAGNETESEHNWI